MKHHTPFYRPTLIAVFVLLLSACAKDNPPSDPEVPTLVAPINETACLDGQSLNDTQSSVTFQWTQATFALSYQVVVTNLATKSESVFAATTNALDIALTKEEPYKWKVIAEGEEGTTPAESESWKFYLAGNPKVNYAPFPAELISPRSGASVTPTDGQITISWNCSDIDGDLSLYHVFLDTTDASTLVEELNHEQATTEAVVTVEANQVYYWKVIAIDANGNRSSSGVYSFRTQ
jgi:hypothetical protein